MNMEERFQLIAKVNQVFRPGAPVDKYELFAGRQVQVNDVLNAVFQPGRHVIIYGERGVGKTSLATVLSEVLNRSGLRLLESGTINCDGSDNFSTLWHKIFREMSVVMETKQLGFFEGMTKTSQRKVSLESLLPSLATPDDVRFVLKRLPEASIIIIDEIDRIKDRETTTLLADTIKNLSDHAINSTLVLVGVAESVEDLIVEHKSIERALVQVPMPRMSRDELTQIIDKGLTATGMTMDDGAKGWITFLSQGLPYYTHSLALYSALKAIDNDRISIEMNDVAIATRTAVEKSHTIRSAYNKATVSPQKQSLYDKVLLACALAERDNLGYFPAAAVSKPMSLIMGKKYYVTHFVRHLEEFCEEKRGRILQKKGDPRRYRYRFTDSLIRPFLILNGMANGTLTLQILETLYKLNAE